MADTAPLVLVVDDSQDNRTMCAEYLAFSGFRVVEAADGAEALEKANRLLPDAIVTDLILPITDGWELTRQLKESEATRHIPILAFSGQSFGTDDPRLRKAGFDAFLMKPCAPDAMANKLRELLARARP